MIYPLVLTPTVVEILFISSYSVVMGKLFVISRILFLHLLTFPPYANPVIILIILKKHL